MSKQLAEQQVEWDLHENPETFIPLEFTEENSVNFTGVEVTVQEKALKGLKVYLAERDLLDQEFDILSKEEVTAENVSKFKELRLKYVKNRTQGTNKWHEKESEVSLRYKQFLDAKKRSENAINESREEVLLKGEKYFENLEKQKAKDLNDARIEKIRPYLENAENMTFAEFSDEDFDDLVFAKKTRFENAQKEAEAEALRIETERLAEIERQKAIEEENAKLKAEAEAKELQLKKEREEADRVLEAERTKAKAEADRIEAENQAKLKAEQEAKAIIEAELKAKKEAEIKAENERLAKEKAEKLASEKLAKAGVKVQLDTWIDTFQIEIPTHLKDNEIANEILNKFQQFKSWSKKQSEF